MKLFRWTSGGGKDEQILVYARTIDEAIVYLKTVPLFWSRELSPTRFVEIVAPKGPSPSILIWKFEDSRIDHD